MTLPPTTDQIGPRLVGKRGVAAPGNDSPATHPSPSAQRMRRARHRKREGDVVVSLVIDAAAVQNLIELGWLNPERRGDRGAVIGAMGALATRALATHLRPGAVRSGDGAAT